MSAFAALPSGLLVPEQEISYPGNDAWLELELSASAPGSDPAWVQVETVPPTGGTPNKTITASGANPPTTQNATSVFGGSSLLAVGSGSSLQSPDHDDWDFGAGDFTVEGWFYIQTARKALFAQMASDGTDRAWEMTMDAGSSGAQVFTFYWCPSTADGTSFPNFVDLPFTAALNTWYHLCFVRYGSVLRGFVNGNQLGSDVPITQTIRASSAPLTLLGDHRAAGNDFVGYADELRISKGIARYTAPSFTVPNVAFTRDQYTALLMHCDGPNGGTAYTDSSGAAAAPFDPGTNPAWMEVER